MSYLRSFLLGSFLVGCALPAFCIGEKHFVSFTNAQGYFPIVHSATADPILVDGQDWTGVSRAAGDLALDVERVTGHKPRQIDKIPENGSAELILIGTLGKSPLIDGLIQSGKLDASSIRGKWESTLTAVVDNPMPHVQRALVIAGSDKRGSIFGIYDLSEEIGVSPWYWWADVRTPHHDEIFVQPETIVQGEPAVKYRGIFLNDESPALTGWAREKFGQLNSHFYSHVFELLLRLRANCLWPAMWSNAFNEDDPENPRLADQYGIVMGTSHHEPMLRSQQEWKRHGSGNWDYTTNGQKLREFWKAGVERNQGYESLITVGMRGDGDKPMSSTEDVSLLEKIVHDQLGILQEVHSPEIDKDPKVWALYKEVQGYYEKGMRVPDDVTLLWSDDNWGNLRRLPTAAERQRKGGAGIYYHFDYVGDPRNYNWIDTNAITKVREQMHLALEYGADRLWIVNVGDLKPMEFPTEFFLTYARYPQPWTEDRLQNFTVDWAVRDFGPEHAVAIASAVEDYERYISRRKPEQVSASTYSLSNFDEARRVMGQWSGLLHRVNQLAAVLPADEKASFFELVQHPVMAAANLTAMYVAEGQNALAAAQGRASTNEYAAEVKKLFAQDQTIADQYNHVLLNGKWDHMMDQPHIGYVSWNSPHSNIMPPVREITVPEAGELGVAVGAQAGNSLTLGEFDSVTQQRELFTLFDKGTQPVAYRVVPEASWVRLNGQPGPVSGSVTGDHDLPVEIDWQDAPQGVASTQLVVFSGDREISRITLTARRQDVTRQSAKGFVEGGGYISMEAASYSSRTSDGELHWGELPGYGRTESAMTPAPVNAASTTDSKASLEYQIHTYDSGPMQLECILAPSLNFVPGRGLRFAVSVDGQPRQVVDALEQNTTKDWRTAVSDNAKTVQVPISLAQPGQHVLRIWYVDPGVVLEKLVLSKSVLPYSYLGPEQSFHGSLQ